MQIRTDLAIEQREDYADLPSGVTCTEENCSGGKVTKIVIKNNEGAKALSKPVGSYITVEVPNFTASAAREESVILVANQLKNLIPKTGTVLVAGLGNRNITPDALGPKCVNKVLATRHIEGDIARSVGLENARSVAVISTGVLGQTGIEAFDIIKGVSEKVNPKAVIVIDALASRKSNRLGATVQMSDTGIEPGGGVGNARYEISKKTLGVPVIAVGVPTVIDAATLVYDLTNGQTDFGKISNREMFVTPREVDLLIDRAAALIADGINFALQENLDKSFIREIVG